MTMVAYESNTYRAICTRNAQTLRIYYNHYAISLISLISLAIITRIHAVHFSLQDCFYQMAKKKKCETDKTGQAY